MNTIKLMLILALIIVGLCNRRHAKPPPESSTRAHATQTALDQEILKNAEHLAETLRHCQQTAHNNKETK